MKFKNKATGEVVDAFKLGDKDFPQRNVQFPPCGPKQGFYYVVGMTPGAPGYGACAVYGAKVFESENEPETGGPLRIEPPATPEPPQPEPPKPEGE